MIANGLPVGALLCGLLFSAHAVEPTRHSLFDGLTADNLSEVTSNKPVELPQDHRPHWGFQIEWWYLTLLLNNEQGDPFNYQFTLFKFARPEIQSNWGDGYVWMGHSSLHTADKHYFTEKFAQQGAAIAGVDVSPLRFYIDNWQWQSSHPQRLFPAQLTANAETALVSLQLSTDKPFVKHGDQGISVKTADGYYRSYYYSQPFLSAEGQIEINGKRYKVSGIGWYDHEWTSQLADEDALGWDWFSLHFDNGHKLMVFTMHANNRPAYTTGTLVDTSGHAVTLGANELNLTALQYANIAGRDIPIKWQITVPNAGIDVSSTVFKEDQWNNSRFPYYEGAISFHGSHSGKGYMELTGY